MDDYTYEALKLFMLGAITRAFKMCIRDRVWIGRQENNMHISYKPLWHTLLERHMRKEDLRLAAGMTMAWLFPRIISIPSRCGLIRFIRVWGYWDIWDLFLRSRN